MIALKLAPLIAFAFLTGCAKTPRFTVHAIAQDGPVQTVSIVPDGDNLLAHITVKNTTDRPVENFTITYAIVRPKNCVVNAESSADALMVLQVGQGSTRPLMPYEQTEITLPSVPSIPALTRQRLEQQAQENNARKLHIQVWIRSVNFKRENVLPGQAFAHVGPDWHDSLGGPVPDRDDAARQACR